MPEPRLTRFNSILQVSCLSLMILNQFSSCQASENIKVNVDKAETTSITRKLSGFNTVYSHTPADFADPSFRTLVKSLSPGNLRWPGGIVDDVFDWKTGEIDLPKSGDGTIGSTMMAQELKLLSQYQDNTFYTSIHNLLQDADITFAKGGNSLGGSDGMSGFAGLAKASNQSGILIVVNSISDTPQSAHDLAYYVASHHIPVTGFELGNEAFYAQLPAPGLSKTSLQASAQSAAPGVFTSGADYLQKMKSYDQAIKQGYVDAGLSAKDAVVSIDGGYSASKDPIVVSWFNSLSQYTSSNDAYWDAVSMHHYPPAAPQSSTFSAVMQYANQALKTEGASYYGVTLPNYNWALNKKIIVSEYDATLGDQRINGSLYGGIFAAEFIMRLSVVRHMTTIDMQELTSNTDGIVAPATALAGSADWQTSLEALGAAHKTMTTLAAVAGLYPAAQVLAVSVANQAVNASDLAYKTTVTGGVKTVASVTGTLPALYAQAYRQSDNGKTVVLLTNKSDQEMTFTLCVDGMAVSGPDLVTVVASPRSDPSEKNTDTDMPIKVRTVISQNPVAISQYSVSSIELSGSKVASSFCAS